MTKFTLDARMRVPGHGFPEMGTLITISMDMPGDYEDPREARAAVLDVITDLAGPKVRALFEDERNRPAFNVSPK